jgi:DNA-binding transcriptional LysR family regulator
MDIHTLTVFVEVARSGSFSRAAENLYLTQPAVSKRIAALENELSAPLFNRIGRNISLTEPGEILLPKALQMIADADEMQRAVSSLSDHVGGKLLMATSHHIGLHRLPDILRSFSQSYPDVDLDIRFMDSEIACQLVEQGELEMAIVTLPTDKPEKLQLEHLWTDQLRVVAATDHPLPSERHVPLDELTAYAAVLPGPTTYTRQILEKAFSRLGLQLTVNMSTNYLETLKMLAETGLGWSVIPHTMLSSELKIIECDMKLTRNLGAVTHRMRTLSNAAKAMLELARHSRDE